MSTQLQALARRLIEGDTATRLATAEELSRLPAAARDVAVSLVRAAADTDGAVRDIVQATLEDLGPPQASDAPQLADLVSDLAPDVAYWAATLLGRLGHEAVGHTERLVATLTSHPAANVRQRAAWALGKIGANTPAVRAVLTNAAQSPDARLARLAVEALEALDD